MLVLGLQMEGVWVTRGRGVEGAEDENEDREGEGED